MEHWVAALIITPATIMAGADNAVVFTVAVDCSSAKCPKNMELVQWSDATQQKVKYRWSMEDKGLWGDEKAGDHIYSRQAYFKQQRPTTLFFTAAQNKNAQLQVTPHPTFFDLLRNVFTKLKGSFTNVQDDG